MRVLRAAVLASAIAAPVYVGTNFVVAAFVGVSIWGGATAWLIAPRDTLLQRATPVPAHGRILAIDNALRSWAHVVALPLAALMVGWFGVRPAAFTFAAVPLFGVLLSRRISDPAPRAEHAPRVDAGLVAVAPAD
jgi:hypothetical protein